MENKFIKYTNYLKKHMDLDNLRIVTEQQFNKMIKLHLEEIKK